MKTLLIKNGRVVDPASNRDEVADVLIEGDKIKAVGRVTTVADAVIDATGKVVTPGLIDMHVHLREPGMEEEETIASGAAAAVAGGITTACCMPNTDPAIDNEASAEFVFLQAERADLANIYPIGAVTKGRQGKELAEIGQLSRGGAVAFSDDGDSIDNSEVMRRALEYAKMFNKPIVAHCEDKSLSADGIMHEGYVSMVLGLPGIPAASEEVVVSRNLILVRMTGGKLHIAHVSTAGSVELIRRAKEAGVQVTAEAAPHHFTLTDECLRTFDTNLKVNPPLRSELDMQAVREGLADGTIDCIASDHAPHSPEEKEVELDLAPFGMIGMETMLGLVIKELISSGLLSWSEAIAALTIAPARILDIPKGTLAVGADADLTVIDPDLRWTVDVSTFKSKSRNCPFDGWELKGKAVLTIVGGEVKYDQSQTASRSA